MDLARELLELQPLERRAVAAVYFEGRTSSEAARVLGVERSVVAAALGSAFRVIGRRVVDDEPPAADDDVDARVSEQPVATTRFTGATVRRRRGVAGPPG